MKIIVKINISSLTMKFQKNKIQTDETFNYYYRLLVSLITNSCYREKKKKEQTTVDLGKQFYVLIFKVIKVKVRKYQSIMH